MVFFIPDVKFYASVLDSWTVLRKSRQEFDHFGLNEPLFYNYLLGDSDCKSNTTLEKNNR